MKKSIKNMILISTLFVLSFFCLKGIYNVKADSGWDSSYDSGSSSSSSSSSSSYSSSSYDYEGEEWIAVPLFTIMIIVLALSFVVVIKNFNNAPYTEGIDDYEDIDPEKVNDIIANFDIKKFCSNAYNIFYDVQIAWMEFNYDRLKELLTDELYNTYVMDLDALKLKNQKNVMKDFELLGSKLICLEEQNDKYIAKVVIEVKFYDYIEDSKTHEALRGTDEKKLDNTYILTFERTKKRRKKNICPQCGAHVEGNSTGICEFCKSKLINDTYDWVMSKKEKIDQK